MNKICNQNARYVLKRLHPNTLSYLLAIDLRSVLELKDRYKNNEQTEEDNYMVCLAYQHAKVAETVDNSIVEHLKFLCHVYCHADVAERLSTTASKLSLEFKYYYEKKTKMTKGRAKMLFEAILKVKEIVDVSIKELESTL